MPRPLILAILPVVCALTTPTAALAATSNGSISYSQEVSGGLQINVATLDSGVRFELQARQLNDNVTSIKPLAADCADCAVAVNADFFNAKTQQPYGGVIVGGVVLRSPSRIQNQLTISPDGSISAGILFWKGDLIESDGTQIPMAVNDPVAYSSRLYDGHFGQPTPVNTGQVELRFLALSAAGMRLGQIHSYRYLGRHIPGTAVPPGEIVVTGDQRFASDISRLQRRIISHQVSSVVQLSLATVPPAQNSLGANDVLVRHGQIMPIPGQASRFADGPNPRTLFGWNDSGQITLMTIGSTQPGVRAGVSLAEASVMLQARGVTNAVNLDGGGSSTFVSDGRVLNNPSDGGARPVANAWVVLIRPGLPLPPPPTTTQPPPVVTTTAPATLPPPPTVAATTTALPLKVAVKPRPQRIASGPITTAGDGGSSKEGSWPVTLIIVIMAIALLATVNHRRRL